MKNFEVIITEAEFDAIASNKRYSFSKHDKNEIMRDLKDNLEDSCQTMVINKLTEIMQSYIDATKSELSYRNVLDVSNVQYDELAVMNVARQLGYRYYLWNDRVYRDDTYIGFNRGDLH